VSVVFYSTVVEANNALHNQYMTWDVTEWDTAAWANLELGRQMNNGNLIIYDYEATKSRFAMAPNGDTSLIAGNTNGSINLTTTGTGQA